MNFYLKHPELPGTIAFDREAVLERAERALRAAPFHITDAPAPLSAGGPNDYYSNGDYWWPNPDTADGLPYVNRDGETNPANFDRHRIMLRRLRTYVAALAAAYQLTGSGQYAGAAAGMLKEFFLDARTRMNPHLLYAQAIPGVCPGRGVGIIDTLHLIEIPVAVECLSTSKSFPDEVYDGLKQWFADYLQWISTHPYGIAEMNAKNNHSVAWFTQAAVFARFTGDQAMIGFCREKYRGTLLPNQMAPDGSFPLELARTKPYSYSIFVLDNLVTLCHVLSAPGDDLWEFELADGRSIRKGLKFLYPYLADKAKWPYPPDVQHFDGWPAGISMLLLAGVGLGEPEYLQLWQRLDPDPGDLEIRRNMAIRQPALWLR